MTIPGPDRAALSPGTRTDLEVMLLQGSLIEPRDGCLVVRSPRQPNYHWGNCLHVTTGDPDDADHWMANFAADFPDAGWVAIGLPHLPGGSRWQELGLTPEEEDVLTRPGRPQHRPLPDGYRARPFASQDDWDQLLELDLAERAVDVGTVTESYVQFCREQQASRQQLVAQGRLRWFGAFTADDRLASGLGIVVLGEDRRLARYQSVLTHPEHRRRGLAGHLLTAAADWASQCGAREFVIVTEASNPAGRLYRSVGFAAGRCDVAVYRAPSEEEPNEHPFDARLGRADGRP